MRYSQPDEHLKNYKITKKKKQRLLIVSIIGIIMNSRFYFFDLPGGNEQRT